MDEPGTGADEQHANRPRGGVWEVAGVFLRLGIIGFGGPAAHR